MDSETLRHKLAFVGNYAAFHSFNPKQLGHHLPEIVPGYGANNSLSVNIELLAREAKRMVNQVSTGVTLAVFALAAKFDLVYDLRLCFVELEDHTVLRWVEFRDSGQVAIFASNVVAKWLKELQPNKVMECVVILVKPNSPTASTSYSLNDLSEVKLLVNTQGTLVTSAWVN
ncbi:MAG TPA: hypothetical protein VEA59_02445 [Patescibacteria group bacterium]|nr:hypothetical protein [Patescibacteria group bacterium]